MICLARIFGSSANFLSFRNNYLHFDFKILFNLYVSLCLPGPPKPWRRRLWPKLVSISVNSWFRLFMKTNPKRTQTNPIFRTPNLILSLLMRIFDKFTTTFLCKTNPNFSKIQFENKGLTTVSLVQHQKVWCCGKVGAAPVQHQKVWCCGAL